MFYFKRNLPTFERLARLTLAACSMVLAHMFLAAGWIPIVIDVAAVLLAATALFGYCPAAAACGRKSIVSEP